MSNSDRNNYDMAWNNSPVPEYNFNVNDLGNMNNEELLNFQSFDNYYDQNIEGNYMGSHTPNPQYLEPLPAQKQIFDPYSPVASSIYEEERNAFEEEPPLLEELGIYPDRIAEKTLSVLNPFHYRSSTDVNLLCETDLAGPLAFCILLGACLLLAGGKAHFGYVYGLVMISCPLMYILLSLMTNEGNITFGSVASILGYCLLPLVFLSVFGVFMPLFNIIGLVLASASVLWSSLSASRLFVTMSRDSQQRPLIAYPCALLYGTFALIIVF